MLNSYASFSGGNFRGAVYQLTLDTLRDVKSKAISDFYEVIKNYFDHKITKKRSIVALLENKSWWQMLHMLRRNISHFDNLGKEIGGWQNSYPSVIQWGGLSIRPTTLGHEIKYSDFFVITLLDEGFEFIEQNRAVFE